MHRDVLTFRNSRLKNKKKKEWKKIYKKKHVDTYAPSKRRSKALYTPLVDLVKIFVVHRKDRDWHKWNYNSEWSGYDWLERTIFVQTV